MKPVKLNGTLLHETFCEPCCIGIVGGAGTGKTTMALHMAFEMLNAGKAVVWFNNDMKEYDFMEMLKGIRNEQPLTGSFHVFHFNCMEYDVKKVKEDFEKVQGTIQGLDQEMGMVVFDTFHPFDQEKRHQVSMYLRDLACKSETRCTLITGSAGSNLGSTGYVCDYIYETVPQKENGELDYYGCPINIRKNRYNEKYGIFQQDGPEVIDMGTLKVYNYGE